MAGNEGTSLAQLIEPAPAPELALLPQPQASAQGATPASARTKPRGRPPGSRNKPKPPVVVVRESAGAMRPVVLELAAGCDVAGAVAAFARRRGVGVSVLCGRGALAAVTLWLSTSAGASRAVRLDGRFDVLSLSGTVLPAAGEGAGAGADPTPFSVSLAGGDGQVVGGTLAGEMTAADGGVVLVAATFVTAEVHRLPAVEAEAVVEGDDGRGGRQEEEKRPPTSPPPPPQQQQQHQQQAMVAASAADVGHVAAYGGVLGWGPGGHPGQVGHYAQHAEQMLSPWGLFPDSRAAPNHPASSSHHHYL